MRVMVLIAAIVGAVPGSFTYATEHDVSVTIYADDLALVQDHRTINV